MSEAADRLVWIDLEMTGLDVTKESIIEIATVITDGELNVLAQGPNLAISVDESLLAGMDEWNTTHHTSSGLVERVKHQSVSLEEAERQTLEFLCEWVPEGTAPLCGNSVWNDKKFMEKEMPSLVAHLHYRMIDVSTVKELARRWYPGISRYEKKGAHLALDDILESIEELRYFRTRVFKK
ncbi:MAG: oligoribonuclease [Candidatus Poseidoniaceae archaeon]|jgi:oligoribonuclease|tara:strand:- start:87 stop:629 length:543 start_codon:yes stop_codon:yes gene_type:complete